MEYNIRFEFKLPPDEAHGDELVTALEAFHPAAGPVGNGNLDAWITIEAANVRQAIDIGLALASTASAAELVAFEALPTAEFDWREGLTPVPPLIGSDEAAEILGITRQAIGKKFTAGDLPGHRVGDRTLVFARTDIEAIAARRTSRNAE